MIEVGWNEIAYPFESGSQRILDKCGVTEIERSRDILSILLTVSDATMLIDRLSSRFAARMWLDEVDEALICPDDRDWIVQRYLAALVYFQLIFFACWISLLG